ncbi:hypothetical protein [Spartinivicinus marinus]|nr:hypothetical protein [Spartinivicinus marinus]MCX4025130.1 hypothetical protein [Spartinivicinus marinus]
MIEINKQLIKQVFPRSMFKQLARPTVSQTAINVKPGQWVWEDGQGNTYSLDGIVEWHANDSPFNYEYRDDVMYQVYLRLSQLHGYEV